ncbi:hypothetical protein LCGC14_1917680 [marine sediment metagenome]|uniref:Nuclease associated modular domain-containing protein n=1 Tax=marine sediment metagenome TaxID=412755 RepID=A0A0F9FRI7_9ZZZZ
MSGNYKRTKEYNKKMSIACQCRFKNGWIFSKEHRKKISESNRRRIYTLEMREKMSEAHKGNIHSEETKRKMSVSRKGLIVGEKHYRWNPDREAVRRDLRNDAIYKQWVKLVKDRDNWKCRIANENCNGKVVAHHILSWADYLELRYEINNGITLCQAHHPLKRAEEKRLVFELQELVSVSS